MKKINLYSLLLFLTVFTVFSCGEEDSKKNEVVYMDNFRVFEEFEMKKDFDKQIERELGPERARLDAMAKELEGITNEQQLNLKKKELYAAQQAFDQQFSAISEKYTQEVYERLNKYIQAYGKKNHYKIILGTTGQGNVMYIDSTADVTKDLIQYANQQYAK